MVTAGAAAGHRLALGEELVIGRAVSGDGMLSDDHELSRRHARVARDAGGQLTIEDLGSANGTFVNGERMRDPHPLEAGRLGEDRLEHPAADAGRPGTPGTGPSTGGPRRPAAGSGALHAGNSALLPWHGARPRRRHPRRDGLRGSRRALPAGSIIAGCRIEDVISHGDMAIVYRAEELALQRPVALKLIHPRALRGRTLP